MASTLEAICAQLQTYLATLSGVRAAPAIPTDGAPPGLFTLCYPGGGTWKQQPAGSKTGVHSIIVEVYVPFKDTARDLDLLYPFYESVPNLLFNKLFNDNAWNNTIDTFGDITDSKPITTKYNDIPYWLIQFTVLAVKTVSAVS